MSASEGGPSLVVLALGVREAEGWRERSTSSGSSLRVEGGARGGVSLGAQLVLFKRRAEEQNGMAYRGDSVFQIHL